MLLPENGYVETDYGERQVVMDEATMEQVQKMDQYMHEYVLAKPEFRHVKDRCRNNNEQCAYWAARGECNVNPKFMKV